MQQCGEKIFSDQQMKMRVCMKLEMTRLERCTPWSTQVCIFGKQNGNAGISKVWGNTQNIKISAQESQ